MREIKFRAWDKKEKTMDKPFDLYSVGYLNGENGYDAKYYILLQYTGLHDKNGKEIYEGDIVKMADPNGIYDKDTHTIRIENLIEGDSFYDSLEFQDCEVIGNIYENPELIGG